MVTFGGMADKGGLHLLNDVWVLEHASGLTGTPFWRELEPEGEPPAPRAVAAALFLRETDCLVMFGGCTRGPHGCDIPQNDVWKLAGATRDATPRWIGQEALAGPERSLFALGRLRRGFRSVFGGGGASLKVWNDAWALSGLREGTSLEWDSAAKLSKTRTSLQ